MNRIRVLALDHFFDQDLRALAADQRLDVRRFPYQRLRRRAVRMMGARVATGLEEFTQPGLESARRRYSTWLVGEVRRMYLERPFDIIVLPSDTFFYVRSLPDAAHRLNLPVVVVQKETTIAETTMEVHSHHVRLAAPVVSDFMTVCSVRHREFWLRAGADGNLVEVTGQPRFDIYASQRSRKTSSTPRRVLFLNYELDSYVPGVGRGAGLRTWAPLRDATEAVLMDTARGGGHDVVFKCHPQQNWRSEAARISARAGQLWNRGVSVAPVDADTRELIVASDVVVGFQTTALFEAVAAATPAIYAAWGQAYEHFRSGLIAFDEAPTGCTRHATSPEHLAELLSQPLEAPTGCAAWYEEALGPVDGRATERVADRLVAIAAAWPPTAARQELNRRRRSYAVGLLARSLAAEALWTAGMPVARVAGQQDRLAVRRMRAREGRAMATTTLRGDDAQERRGVSGSR
jgi:hypothetical protein